MNANKETIWIASPRFPSKSVVEGWTTVVLYATEVVTIAAQPIARASMIFLFRKLQFHLDDVETSSVMAKMHLPFFDTHRSIRLPLAIMFEDDWIPRDQSAREAICFSRHLDSWFVQKREEDSYFWRERLNSTEPPLNSMFFASHHGPFRIYPARQSEACGRYDARLRPWYVAGSSGPKNIVLMLDVSGTMKGDRLDLLKQASQRVVNATTIHDRITVVSFNSTVKAYATNDGHMFEATEDNTAFLNKAIANLTAGGGTDYYEAFDKMFDVLDATIANEGSTACHTAVIFLTDDGVGNKLLGKNLTEVKSLVATRLKSVSDAIDKPAILFTYSLSSLSSNSSNSNAFDATSVSSFLAELACEVDYGVWTHVSNDNNLTVDFLSNYYRMFAWGFESSPNDDTFVAWVDPYIFASPANTWGTTVSRPVYDRDWDPPIFLGVVGIDLDLRALEAALRNGVTPTAKETISDKIKQEVRKRSIQSCSREVHMTKCEIDAYQSSSHSYHQQNKDEGSNQATSFCESRCTDPTSVRVQEQLCDGVYPKDLWNNTHFQDQYVSYTDRFCCRNHSAENAATPAEEGVCLAAPAAPAVVPTSSPAGSANEKSNNGALSGGAIAGIALSLVAVMVGILFFGWRRGIFARDEIGGESSPVLIPPPPPATNPSYAMWETTAPTAP
jgi:uncharacterized protein YegL